jgi:hypothetical protein
MQEGAEDRPDWENEAYSWDDQHWFPSTLEFISTWADAAEFPLKWEAESRHALLIALLATKNRATGSHFKHAMRSHALTWVLQLAQAGCDLQLVWQSVLLEA